MSEEQNDSCFECKNYKLCFIRHGIDKVLMGGAGVINAGNYPRKGSYKDVYRALGGACLVFMPWEDD